MSYAYDLVSNSNKTRKRERLLTSFVISFYPLENRILQYKKAMFHFITIIVFKYNAYELPIYQFCYIGTTLADFILDTKFHYYL